MKKSRWICLLILYFIFVVIGTRPCMAANQVFPDVKDHWAKDYITQLSSLGYVGGYPDGTFKPDATISRAEFTSALITCMGVTVSDTTSRNFSDTPGNWAIASINEAVKRGILIPGEYPNGLVPNGGIKRSEACAMLIRALSKGPTNGIPSFIDKNDLQQSMYVGYIKTACDLGIMAGYSDGNFKPYSTMTRAQAFTVLYKFLAQQGKVSAIPSTAPTSTTPITSGSTGTIKYVSIGDNVFDCKQAAFIVNFQEVPVTSITASNSSIIVNGYYTFKLDSSNNPDIIIYNNRYSYDELTISGDKLVLSASSRKIYKFEVKDYTYNSDYISLYVNSANKGYYLSDMEIIDENEVKVGSKTYKLGTDKLTIAVTSGNSGTKNFYDIEQIDLQQQDTEMELEATDPVVMDDLEISDIAAIFVDDTTLNLDRIDNINFIMGGEKYNLSQVTIDASGNFSQGDKDYTYKQVAMIIDDMQYKIDLLHINKSKYVFYCSEGSIHEWVIVDDEYRDAADIKIIKGTTIYDSDEVIVVERNLIRIGGKQYKLDSDFKCRVDDKIYAIDEINYDSSKEATVIETGDLADTTLASQPNEIIFFNDDSRYQRGTSDVTIYTNSKWQGFEKIFISDPSHYVYQDETYELIGARIKINGVEFEIADTSWHGANEVLDIYMEED
ncbi:MAG: S-layer homology domain-containing protein [Syntrophomonas sp.]